MDKADVKVKRTPKEYFTLFLTFFKIGAFTFGAVML